MTEEETKEGRDRREFLALAAKGSVGAGIVVGGAQALQLLRFLQQDETFMPDWKGDLPYRDDDGYLKFNGKQVSRAEVIDRIHKAGTFIFMHRGLYHGKEETMPGLISEDSQGALHAASRKCTHEGCMVVFAESINVAGTNFQHVWYCNCHDGVYTTQEGKVLAGPPPSPLPQFTVEFEEDGAKVRLVER